MPLHQSISLHFKKAEPQTILTVKRADGTSTWMKLYPNTTLHDLAHYAIETELALTKAFYGILAEGYNIEEFEMVKEERPFDLRPENLQLEALQVEHLVNLLLTELQSGEMEDFLFSFGSILENAGLSPMLKLTEERLISIRKELNRLRFAWEDVAYGEELVLEMS